MRKNIKYKVWNTAKNEWFTPIYEAYLGRLHDVSIDRGGMVIERTIQYCSDIRNTNKLIPVECTHMNDKNGTEIHDGDLVKDGSDKYPHIKEVYWDDRYQWSLRLVINKQFVGSLHNNKDIVPEDGKLEIIGNVFENPELLTGDGFHKTPIA